MLEMRLVVRNVSYGWMRTYVDALEPACDVRNEPDVILAAVAGLKGRLYLRAWRVQLCRDFLLVDVIR